MLFQKQTQIYFQKPYRKVLHLFPSSNNTYVILCILNKNTYKIIHLSHKGKQLWQKQLNNPVDTLQLINQNLFFVLSPKQNCFIFCIPHLKASFQHKHNFLSPYFDRLACYVFTETKYVVLAQLGNHVEDKSKITYYKVNKIDFQKIFNYYQGSEQQNDNKSDFFHKLSQLNDVLPFDCKLAKGNNRSMFIWWIPKILLTKNQKLQFYSLELPLNSISANTKPQHYKLILNNDIESNDSDFLLYWNKKSKQWWYQSKVQSIISVEPQIYFIYFTKNYNLQSYFNEAIIFKTQKQMIKQGFNSINKSLKQLLPYQRFTSIKNKQDFINILSSFFIKNSFIKSYNPTNIKNKIVSNVDKAQRRTENTQNLQNHNDTLMGMKAAQQACYISKQQVPNYKDLVIENKFYKFKDIHNSNKSIKIQQRHHDQNQNNQNQTQMPSNNFIQKVITIEKRILQPKFISLFFLLQMNKDFDQDLLMDVVEIIQYQEKGYTKLQDLIDWGKTHKQFYQTHSL